MAEKTRITTQAILVIGGIVVAFVAFLLMLFIPSGTYFLLLNIGIFGLVLVALAAVTEASRPALLRILAGVGDSPVTGPFPALSRIVPTLLILLTVFLVVTGGFPMIILIATEVIVLWVGYSQSRFLNPEENNHTAGVDASAGNGMESSEQKRVAPDLSESRNIPPPNPFWFRIFTLGFGLLAASYFLYEVLPLIETNTAVPLPVTGIMALLILFFCILAWRARSLPPAAGEMQRVCCETATATGLVVSLCSGPLLPFVLVTALFNSGIALVLVLARDQVIDLNLAHANGFILFLVYTFGNLLILAAALLYLERAGYLPVGENIAGLSATAGDSPGMARNRNALGIIVCGFTALYFMGVMLAFVLGFVGPETHDYDLLVTIDTPDPRTVMVTYLGGKDAGKLVGLEASAGYMKAAGTPIDPPYREVIAQGFLGSQKGTEPVLVNRTITMNIKCPGSCTVEVIGYFSDGRYQKLNTTPIGILPTES